MEKLNKDKLILPVVILLASLVLGGFYYASQVSKQKSIERQQTLKLEEERKTEEAKLDKEQQDKDEASKKIEEEKKTREVCQGEAKEKARELVKKKMELKFAEAESRKRSDPNNQYAGMFDREEAESLKELADKSMFLTGDYEKYYGDCLERNGLQK